MDYASSPAEISLEDCQWYHVMDLPGIGSTPGAWDLRGEFAPYIGNVDLRGRSVLDIGAASGFLTFSAEQAGAAEVTSFDLDTAERQTLLPFRESLYCRDHDRWVKETTRDFQRWKNAYWLAHKVLGSKARVIYGDVYNLPAELPQFDVVIMCAVLDHLSDPVRAMTSVSRHAGGLLVLGVYIPRETEETLAWFLGNSANPETASVHWAYSLPVYREVLAMLGFEIASVVTRDYQMRDKPMTRSAIVARRLAI